jgi:hypothetical protein
MVEIFNEDKDTRTVTCGDIFVDSANNEPFMFVMTQYAKYQLVSLDDGNRYSDIYDNEGITIDEILSRGFNRYIKNGTYKIKIEKI